MDHQDLRKLNILEEIGKEQTTSQRDLSRKLNISLGLVNSFIKRLVQKGYCKVTTIPRNRVRYLLTPKGAAEKTRLTYAYLQFSIKFYREARGKLQNLFNHLETLGFRHIVFYGASDIAEIAYLSLQETSLSLIAIIDDSKGGETFFNFPIMGSASLSKIQFDCIIITKIEKPHNEYLRIKDFDIPPEKIFMV